MRSWGRLCTLGAIMDHEPFPETVLLSIPAEPTEGSIALRAYALWEEEGRPAGKDVEHWLRAERELQVKSEQAARGGTGSERTGHSDTDTRMKPVRRAPEPGVSPRRHDAASGGRRRSRK